MSIVAATLRSEMFEVPANQRIGASSNRRFQKGQASRVGKDHIETLGENKFCRKPDEVDKGIDHRLPKPEYRTPQNLSIFT